MSLVNEPRFKLVDEDNLHWLAYRLPDDGTPVHIVFVHGGAEVWMDDTLMRRWRASAPNDVQCLYEDFECFAVTDYMAKNICKSILDHIDDGRMSVITRGWKV